MSAALVGTTQYASNEAGGKFHNSEINYESGLGDLYGIMKSYLTATRNESAPKNRLPGKSLTKETILATSKASVARLGHSSMLIRLDGKTILTDPVFSKRASPVQWAGPKRFQEAAITAGELPDIDVVLISHDHYDHLDKATVQAIHERVSRFLVPLKVGKYLKQWGVAEDKITELDWWQEVQIDSIRFAATPTQHFSGRGLFDRDTTLWASWVMTGAQANLFFSGDSGYFSGFKAIGETYGPFDLTMIETGAYNQAWHAIHMMPEESVEAHKDLKGDMMIPIHNATFDLALHDWYEPLERAFTYANQQGVTLLTPQFGEMVILSEPQQQHRQAWWRGTETSEESEVLVAAVE